MTDTDDDTDTTAVVTDADLGIDPVAELDHRPIDSTTLAAAFSLIVLLPDQKLFRSRLKGLANALAAIAAARTKLVDERAAHDERVAKDRAELDSERSAQQRRQVAVSIAEGQLQEREARCREREIELGLCASDPDFVPLEGTTITKDPERPRTVRYGADGTPFARGTTITRSEYAAPVPVQVRRGRPRAGA